MGASPAPASEASAGSSGSPDAAACGDVFAALLASLAPPTAIPTCGVHAGAEAAPNETAPDPALDATGDVPTCAFGGPGTVPTKGRTTAAPPPAAPAPSATDLTLAVCPADTESAPPVPDPGTAAPAPELFDAPATTPGTRRPTDDGADGADGARDDAGATGATPPGPTVLHAPTVPTTVAPRGDDLPPAGPAPTHTPAATGRVTPPQGDVVVLERAADGTAAGTDPGAAAVPPATGPETRRDTTFGEPASDLTVLDVVATPPRTDPVNRELAPTSIGRLVAATVPQMRSSSDDVRLSVRLDPPSLGHVTVDISTRDGAVHVVIRPTEATSTDVLAAQRSTVSAALADAGFQLGGFDVRSNDRRDAPKPAARTQSVLDAEIDDPPTIDDGALRL
jgi:hypothetical protein